MIVLLAALALVLVLIVALPVVWLAAQYLAIVIDDLEHLFARR